jgi:adenylate kinase family enzyme
MQRISVVGSTASGKTSVARAIADALSHPFLELDSVYHQPDWVPLPDDEFREVVGEFAANGPWVIDGNYTHGGVLDLVWGRADTVVWVDPPKSVVMQRVIWRTIRRGVTREELWNGNREPLSNFTSWDPEQNVIRWAWTRYDSRREEYESAMINPTWTHLTFIRLRSSAEAAEFIGSLSGRVL